jgi:WD40 repeat protein
MGRMMRVVLQVVMLLCAGMVTAFAAEPPTEPVLRIDPGMHTAMITRIATDAAGRFLVTASNDKSLRVWELPTGRLIRTIRPPAGDGDEGKLYSVALSPDGRTIAASGWTKLGSDSGNTIYLFDRATGEMTGRITGLPNVIHHLAFSPDGKWLAAALGAGHGIRVYRTSNFSLAAEDEEYGSRSNSAHFSHDGRLVTTCYDGFVRLYEAGPSGWGQSSGQVATLSPRYKVKAPDGERPFPARFSPDGTKIAVGYYDTAQVTIFSGRNLSDPVTLADSPNNNYLNSITWSLDGKFLYAGGGYQKQIDGVWTCPIRRWSDEGRGAFIDIPGGRNTIMELAPLPDGGVAFGSATPDFGMVSSKGERILFVPPANPDLSNNLDGFLLVPDGSTFRFSFESYGKAPALFDLATRQLILDGSAIGLTAPLTTLSGVEVTEWEDTFNPKLNGEPLILDDYERSRSLALAPNGESFVLGTNWGLRCFDKQGRELWNVPVPGTVWGVNIPANGKVVVATFADGTIRWYRLKDGKELLAFFPHADQKRWVLWTPSGYYDASVGGEDLIGWQVNRSKDKAADFFPASRFRDTYYRPDIVAKALTTLDEEEAVCQANAERGIAKGATPIKDLLPPVIEIIEPADGNISASSTTVTLSYRVRSTDNQIPKVRAEVNYRPVPTVTPKGGAGKQGEGEIKVTIPEEDCEIALFAENNNALSTPVIIHVKWQGKASAIVVKPRLIILAVGINDYQDRALKQLKYATKDANDFSTVFMQQEGLLYSKVITKVITDATTSRDKILEGLEWLEENTTNKDIAVIFLSGHGVNDREGRYYFLPSNGFTERLKVTGLPLSSIKETVAALPGKVLLFLDTCHAGNVDLNGIINTLSGSGVGAIVFASSNGQQQSLELEAFKNGAFTKALVEGLYGDAADKKGKITVPSLESYVSDRVEELTNKQQTPVVGKPLTPTYPIAIKKQ